MKDLNGNTFTKEREDFINKEYKFIVDKIGDGYLAIIHLKHIDDFTIELDKIKKEAQKELLEKIKKMFAERQASNFCGCYEGDINDYYDKEVESFLKELSSN